MMNELFRVGSAVAAHPLFQAGRGGAIPTSTLQFEIVEIPMRRAAELNRRWHSLLPRTDLGNLLCGNMSVAFAAEFEEMYFAVAIWSQPIIRQIAAKGDIIELRRMAISDDAPKNTASRMLAVMCRLVVAKYPFVKRAVSYQAIDVHAGTMYRAAGWQVVGKVCEARPQRLRGSKQRATGPLQTTSRKQRWEIEL